MFLGLSRKHWRGGLRVSLGLLIVEVLLALVMLFPVIGLDEAFEAVIIAPCCGITFRWSSGCCLRSSSP